MGFLDKIFGQDMPLSQLLQRDNHFHTATCEECGAAFLVPEFPIAYWSRPAKPTAEIDVGGWCVACRRMLCPQHADFVQLEVGKRLWWVAGCATCQEPLAGRANRQDFLDREA